MANVLISDVLFSDLTELVNLVNSAYRGDSGRQGWTTESDLLDGQRIDVSLLKELLEQPSINQIIQIKNANQNIIGCMHLQKQGLHCYLGMLTVSPLMQGKGLGQILLREAEKRALAWNCQNLTMTVISARHELIDWYLTKGFILTGEVLPFPYGDERFGIPKVDHLEFVVMKKKLTVPSQFQN